MTWEGVPWMVNGAQHSGEVGRMLAYVGSGGGEGVVAPTDLKVTASSTPDTNIHINPGGGVCLNRFAGGASQSYALRNVGDQAQAITAQGSSGTRYDLVCVIVQDQQYAGQPAPASVPNGPYVTTKVYQGVSATTKSIAEVDANQTGYALARIAVPASTGTITNSTITDLRELARPRTLVVERVMNPSGTANVQLSTTQNVVPTGASWAIPVPTWATKVQLKAIVSGLSGVDTGSGGASSASGGAKVALGSLGPAVTSWKMDASGTGQPQSATIMTAGEYDVPSAMRGTQQTLSSVVDKTAGTGLNVFSTQYTTGVVTATFYESVA